MNLVLEYIQYQLNQTNKQALNSFFNRTNYEFPSIWKKLDETFLTNKLKIQVEDLGAGSKKLGLERRVSDIYQVSRTKQKYAVLIQNLIQQHRPKNILELGTSLGIGTRNLALFPGSKVYTVEGCPRTLELAKNHLSVLQIKNVTFFNSSFYDFLTNQKHPPYDFVYLDGHHSGEHLIKYMTLLRPICTDDCLFLLDDIRWNTSMKKAFLELKSHFKNHLDFFQMGLFSNRKLVQ